VIIKDKLKVDFIIMQNDKFLDLKENNFQLNSVQYDIFSGLSNIGEEIASFYLDAIYIINNDNIHTKANLIGHIAREIDGGLRDLFNFSKENEKCEKCNQQIRSSNYKESIAEVLGVRTDNRFVKEWHSVAKNFHKYGHRHGAWKEVREPDDMIHLWSQYEKILLKLIGSYYKFVSRIDRIIEFENPSDPQIGFIINAIKNSTLADYFFKKVHSISWFIPLKNKGYFSSMIAPDKKEVDNSGSFIVPYWNVLDYLERISVQMAESENKKYIPPLLEIMIDVTNNGPKDNYRTWWYFVKIIANLPNEFTTNEIINLIPTWLGSEFDTSMPGKEIGDRLLPKFLSSDNEEDINKAELIIKHLTTLKEIPFEQMQNEYLSKKESCKTLVDTYWLKDAFDNNSKLITEKCSNKVLVDFIEKIEKILSEKSQENTIIYNNKTLLFSLTEENEEYILKIYESNSLIKQEDLYSIINNFMKKKYLPESIHLSNTFSLPLVESLGKFVSSVREDVISEYPEFGERFQELSNFLMYIYLGFYDKGTFESLYNNNILTIYDSLSIFHKITANILLVKTKESPEETKEILELLLNSRYLYLTKLAFYIIGNSYQTYENLFWDYISKDNDNIFLKTTFFGDEIRHIFEKMTDLESDRIQLLDDKIINETENYNYLKKDKKYIESWKQRFYKALSNIPHFKEKYLELKEQTGTDSDMGPAIQDSTSITGPGPSPLTGEELYKMSNEELARFLMEFKTVHPWDGPTEESLSQVLRNNVQTKPEKFTENIDPFIKISYRYFYDMIWGFIEAWNNNEALNWKVLFDFVKAYIDQDEFWEGKLDVKGEFIKADYSWGVGAIGELIEVGSAKYEHSFDVKFDNIALDIISIIIKRLKVESSKELLDPVTHALNSPHGKIITALLYVSLKIAVQNDKENVQEQKRWSEQAKQLFITAIDKNIDESFTLFGQYLTNIYYLDNVWTEEKIKEIINFPEDDNRWHLFMIGYLYPGRVYNNLYELMALNYKRAIEIYSEKDRQTTRLIQHITIAYLRGIDDKLDKPLFKELLNKWNPEFITGIVEFFWGQRNYLTTSDADDSYDRISEKKMFIEKIMDFWRIIFSHYVGIEPNELTENDMRLLGSMVKLSVFLSEINEDSFKWIQLAASYANYDFSSPFLLEYLNNLKDQGYSKERTADFVCDIYLTMLKYYVPDYDRKNIYSTVEYLYEFNSENIQSIKEKVDDICNIYGQSGITDDNGREFLRDLYEKYNP